MSGRRTWVREAAACESCGARQGELCRAYVRKRGKTTGKVTSDVHAARWRAFRAYLREQAAQRG
jgi:hypothetical protein